MYQYAEHTKTTSIHDTFPVQDYIYTSFSMNMKENTGEI